MYLKRNKHLEIIGLYTTGYKNKFYLREISKLLKLPVKTIQDMLQALEKENILKSRIEGKNKYFTLNLTNAKTKLYLLHSEIYKTIKFLEAYPNFNVFLKELRFPDTQVLVFGSFADFSATKDSDLDLLIVSDKPADLPYHLLPYKVHEIKMSGKSFLESLHKNEPLVGEIIKKHVILNGNDYFVNLWWEKYER